MRTVVVLPTYDERHNIGPMLDALLSLRPAPEVLVVDDASPDGTGMIVLERARNLPSVELLTRTHERGLASAYLAGFRRALDRGAEAVVTLDCDFSHPPNDVPRLVAALATADLVIGSRFVP